MLNIFGKRQAKIDLPNVPHDLVNKTSGFLVFGEQCLILRGGASRSPSPVPLSHYIDRYTYRYKYMYNVYLYDTDTHNV